MNRLELGLNRISRHPEVKQGPRDVLRAVAEEVALEGNSPLSVYRAVDGVALENDHVVLYAPDSFRKVQPDGRDDGRSDKQLAGQFQIYSEITQVDIFVSRLAAPEDAKQALEQVKREVQAQRDPQPSAAADGPVT
jgi:hypothetical protein